MGLAMSLVRANASPADPPGLLHYICSCVPSELTFCSQIAVDFKTARMTTDNVNRVYSQSSARIVPAGWHRGWLLWWNLGVAPWQVVHNDFHEKLAKKGLHMESEMNEFQALIATIKEVESVSAAKP